MSAIWLLSTRGRPKQAQATIDACQKAGMTSQGVVYVDEDTGLYDRLRLPANWTIHREPEWLSLQGSMSWCFDSYPDATRYGWLADDVRPRTKGWDKLLEAAAGGWRLAYARDLWMSENDFDVQRLQRGTDLSSGLCWGGNLVREVGWWAFPPVKQAGIDTAWTALIAPLELHAYCKDVIVEHLNWRTGKRPKDHIDSWDADGVPYIDQDIVARNEWVNSAGYRDTLTRLRAALDRLPSPLYDRALGASLEGGVNQRVNLNVDYAMELSVVDEDMRRDGGLKACRLVKLEAIEREMRALERG